MLKHAETLKRKSQWPWLKRTFILQYILLASGKLIEKQPVDHRNFVEHGSSFNFFGDPKF